MKINNFREFIESKEKLEPGLYRCRRENSTGWYYREFKDGYFWSGDTAIPIEEYVEWERVN